MRSSTRTVAPTVEPLSLAEAKQHLRLEHSDDDSSVRRMIAAARSWGENFTRRAFITQTWALYLDRLPAVIELPHPPVQSVSSVQYVDDNGDTQTLSTALYDVDIDAELARVYPAYGETWPSVRFHPKSVTVTYVAGYGDDEDDVPEDIKSGLLLHLSRLYEQREPVVTGTIISDQGADAALLRPYQIHGF